MEEQLRSAPLFTGFGVHELGTIAARGTVHEYARGQTLWRAGDPGEEILVVLSGELAVWGVDDTGDDVVVARLRAGETLGEVAVLLDGPRSATVTCSRAARALALGRGVSVALRDDSRVLAYLARTLSDRLARVTQVRAAPAATTVVGISATRGTDAGSALAAALTQLLATPGNEVVHVRERDAAQDSTDTVVERILLGQLGPCQTAVIELGAGRRAEPGGLDACDVLVEIVGSHDTPPARCGPHTRVLRVVDQGSGSDDRRPLNACEPFILPSDQELDRLPAEERATRWVQHSRRPSSRVVHRLARKILGCTVGVALGGGAAFGIAHVGVLRELEEAGIPIDLVAGTSMGSIVALAYAAGVTPREMSETAQRIGNVRTTISALDPAFSGTGLLGGRRMVDIFGPLTGERQTFADLLLPARTVATDVETGERVDLGEGRLDAAFRASAAVPVLFTPARSGDRTLVDGAMIDPVPVDVARDMGADIVIGVNVVPRLERGVTTALSRTFKRLNRLNPLAWVTGGAKSPDVLDVLMNSLQAVQYELGSFKAASADALVSVDLGGFTWIEFYKAVEIVERGREAGKAAVPAIRAAIDAHLDADPVGAAS